MSDDEGASFGPVRVREVECILLERERSNICPRSRPGPARHGPPRTNSACSASVSTPKAVMVNTVNALCTHNSFRAFFERVQVCFC
jgi:hypothetical protein